MKSLFKHGKEIEKELQKDNVSKEEKLKNVLHHTKQIQEKLTEPKTINRLSQKTKKQNLNELDISKEDLKRFVKGKLKEGKTQKVYSIYKTNAYAKLSNLFVENLSLKIIEKIPSIFKPLEKQIHQANIKILFRTYVSILLFSTLASIPLSIILSIFLAPTILYSILIIIFTPILVFNIIYFYPRSILRGRQNRMQTELVFATIHMAAISGSGTTPSKIFELLIESKDYKELDPEFKKIVNNMNLFGYNLTTSLKAVAATTTSRELKELLDGMASSVETGGSLTNYLREKAEDSLDDFRISQEKHLASLATYSDIYTAVLIAAPLLLLITMVIMERISPSIGNIPVYLIANIGTYVGLPLLNILFITFLSLNKPGL